MGDEYIAVKGYQMEVREKTTEELKETRFDFDKIVTENISGAAQDIKFQPKATLYHEKHGYLIVKKWDDLK